MTGQRFIYYSTWCLTDGQIIASGLGYAGKGEKTGEEKFDKIYSIRVIDVEFGLSPQTMMIHWNHQIHIWLKHYIYNRTLVPGKRPGLMNNMAVFITSAFWHGFYPFYYVMFFSSAILSELAKDIYRSRILFRWIPYPLNSILANFFSMLMMNFMGISFMLLTFEKGWSFSSSVYHFVYIVIVVLFVIFRFGGITKKAAKLEEKLKAKAAEKAGISPNTDN
jgi:lysophospholipid acyltransferase